MPSHRVRFAREEKLKPISKNYIAADAIRAASSDFFRLQQEFKESVSHTYDPSGAHAEVIQHAVDGSIKLLDACALRDLLRAAQPKRVLEVGTFLGFSLRWMLNSTSDFQPSFTSLDPRVRHRIFDNIKDHVASFTAHYQARVAFVDAYLSERNDEMFLHDYLNYRPVLAREDALRLLGGIQLIDEPFSEFDFAFVDGDHCYNATVKNVSLVARMMPDGGHIVVHDAISWPEVKPALTDLSSLPGIEFVGIVGEDFLEWVGRSYPSIPSLELGRALCDGLGLVKVHPGADINKSRVEALLQRR